MPELVRSIVARLREYVGNRRRARRYRMRLSCRVAPFDAALDPERQRRAPALAGHTRDLSVTGLALVLPAVRVGDRYLTGAGLRLRVTLEHPSGPLELLCAPVRHEQLEPGGAETGFLIGVRITELAAADRARYEAHLAQLD
ncbi:MAG TPA: PilZ domain-containing protein [Pyrinomonadaceae bacterium]|jgi:hypothetical protein